ncbi:dephospho-CoA kinase [Colwellia sp. 6_MG-2023]|uniref:dephospho-CoA kinase n=1 Tax=Colwellia sp. 6_MG-2023 TaxID=3062676 RepID=UPI0026E2DF77|nr:dephospho-CoA kinase [Colwellia sp. 6_MG-2023]MDO6487281.1 dephospho-CoA kinase [Colwellia sp. 6_MG-2023]
MSDFIVGLTGGIGSGKTTVTNIFAKLGIDIIDADIIARDVVAKGSPALTLIEAHFGSDILHSDGQLNRAMLRTKIFTNEVDKQWLNALLHPLIRKQIVTQAQMSLSPYCIIVAPLLIENNLTTLVDRVLVVDVNEATQVSRTIARDNNSKKQVEAIIKSQVSRQVRQSHADDILNNDDCLIEDLTSAVAQLHHAYLAYAAQKKANKT